MLLEVYARPYDPRYPVVCMDEGSKQVLRDTRESLPMEPGEPERVDYEYERGGVANLFLFREPLAGRRWVDATEHRTRADWAHQIRELVDERYPEAEKHPEGTRLVVDNLNTHTPASLYEAFPPAEAKRLADTLEIHYTPKHGSWLGYPPGTGGDRAERAGPPAPGPAGARFRDATGGRSRRGGSGATRRAARSTGDSPQTTRASSSSGSTLQYRSDRLLALGERRFDAADCGMALMNMPAIEPLMRSLNRLLRAEGRFVFSVPHPCFNSNAARLVLEEEDARGTLVETHWT